VSVEAGLTLAGGETVSLRRAADADEPTLRDLFNQTVAETGGYPHEPPVGAAEFAEYWIRGNALVVVGEHDEEAACSYFLKANHPGRAAHIANAGYLVAPKMQGRGLGRRPVEHSIMCAREHGFRSIQFNLVFASNPARPMYEDLGFRVVGRLPAAVDGEDALIYWRDL
jgi:GNAT superfamily N-acetyltransferase